MEVINLKLSDLKPYAKNPRNNDEAAKSVAKSIKEFGFQQPIVVDKDYVIIAGHTRYKAAQKLKLKEVPCVIATDLSEEQVKAYRLADNKVGELATWDDDLLNAELMSILDIDMKSFGFKELFSTEEMEKHKNEVPDVDTSENAVRRTKQGDVWQLGRHRLVVGDSTSMDTLSALLGEEKVDLWLTDPPYNVNYEAGAGSVSTERKHSHIENDNMDDTSFRAFLYDSFSAVVPFMRGGAVFYIWHSDTEGYNFRGAVRDVGLTLRQVLIWVKNAAVMGRSDYHWKHEPCLLGEKLDIPDFDTAIDSEAIELGDEHENALYGWKDGAAHLWNSDRKQNTILNFKKPAKSALHPTMKPVDLFEYCIKNSSKEGDIVLDTFGGSGTTIVACETTGRCARVVELDEIYADIIIERWEKLTNGKAVLING